MRLKTRREWRKGKGRDEIMNVGEAWRKGADEHENTHWLRWTGHRWPATRFGRRENGQKRHGISPKTSRRNGNAMRNAPSQPIHTSRGLAMGNYAGYSTAPLGKLLVTRRKLARRTRRES